MAAKNILLLGLATLVASHDLTVGQDGGRKIFDEKYEASPAIWKQINNVTVNATQGEVISKVVITDLRPDKDGDTKIVEGGEGQNTVTVELKSPTILRGYEFHIEVYARPEGQSGNENLDQHFHPINTEGDKFDSITKLAFFGKSSKVDEKPLAESPKQTPLPQAPATNKQTEKDKKVEDSEDDFYGDSKDEQKRQNRNTQENKDQLDHPNIFKSALPPQVFDKDLEQQLQTNKSKTPINEDKPDHGQSTQSPKLSQIDSKITDTKIPKGEEMKVNQDIHPNVQYSASPKVELTTEKSRKVRDTKTQITNDEDKKEVSIEKTSTQNDKNNPEVQKSVQSVYPIPLLPQEIDGQIFEPSENEQSKDPHAQTHIHKVPRPGKVGQKAETGFAQKDIPQEQDNKGQRKIREDTKATETSIKEVAPKLPSFEDWKFQQKPEYTQTPQVTNGYKVNAHVTELPSFGQKTVSQETQYFDKTSEGQFGQTQKPNLQQTNYPQLPIHIGQTDSPQTTKKPCSQDGISSCKHTTIPEVTVKPTVPSGTKGTKTTEKATSIPNLHDAKNLPQVKA